MIFFFFYSLLILIQKHKTRKTSKAKPKTKPVCFLATDDITVATVVIHFSSPYLRAVLRASVFYPV